MTDMVSLDIKTYDKMKSSSVKANLVIDRLFGLATLTKDNSQLVFSSDDVSSLLLLAYPERYCNKVDSLTLFEQS